MPDLARLTSLQELTNEECNELTLLPGICDQADFATGADYF
jgi:hypothetical protein